MQSDVKLLPAALTAQLASFSIHLPLRERHRKAFSDSRYSSLAQSLAAEVSPAVVQIALIHSDSRVITIHTRQSMTSVIAVDGMQVVARASYLLSQDCAITYM